MLSGDYLFTFLVQMIRPATRFTLRCVPPAIALALLVGLIASAAWTDSAFAGSPNAQVPLGLRWSLPQQIPGYDIEAAAPYLIADENRTVHAFNSVRVGQRLIIVYSQWTRANGWTNPIDILLSPWKDQARILGAELDRNGMVHLTFFGGDELGASIYYTKAHLSEVSRAHSWSKPLEVGNLALAPANGALVVDPNGRVTIVYSGYRDGFGLYSISSSDWGETWKEPITAYLAPDGDFWPFALNIVLDEQNNLHAVWTLVNRSGNGEAVYYANLDVEHLVWSDSFLLARRDPGDYEADWGSIAYYNDELIVVYNDSFPATRWMRRSADGGRTWSDPVLPFNFVGEYRFASFVIDAENFLHMFLGNRTRDATHGMWHSVWLGDRWSDLQPVVSGPRITEGDVNGRFDPTGPVAVLSQGNTILVTWSTDPGAGRNGVWYSFGLLNSPEQPVVTLVSPTPRPTRTPLVMPVLQETATPDVQILALRSDAPPTRTAEFNPIIVLVAALVPSTLLISVVLIFFGSRFRS